MYKSEQKGIVLLVLSSCLMCHAAVDCTIQVQLPVHGLCCSPRLACNGDVCNDPGRQSWPIQLLPSFWVGRLNEF